MQIAKWNANRIVRASSPICTFQFAIFILQSLLSLPLAIAEPPSTAYLFPAGGQRGSTVTARIGGHFLHDAADLHLHGGGITAPERIVRGETRWFEGPVIPQPASQQKEDYPVDYAATLAIAADAPLGVRGWSVSTIQGATASRPLIVGRFPEVIEDEVEGAPLPQQVTLPVTINGRIFPRQDVDVWAFDVAAGQTATCAVLAQQIDSPLVARLEVRDPQGQVIAEDAGQTATDAKVRFTAATTGRYSVQIHDVGYEGLQHYVYRLMITAGPFVDSVFPLGGQPGQTLTVALHGANLESSTAIVTLPDDSSGPFWWHPETAATAELGIPLEIATIPSVAEADRDRAPQVLTGPAGVTDWQQIVDGCVMAGGEVDAYAVDLAQGQFIRAEIRAAKWGSLLDSVVTFRDPQGQVVVTEDDTNGNVDAVLTSKASAAGRYVITVADRVRRRGGVAYGYRLHLTVGDNLRPEVPFTLMLSSKAVNVVRGAKTTIKVDAKRFGYQGDIELIAEGLPAGVTLSGHTIPKGQLQTNLVIEATAAVLPQVVTWQLIGVAKAEHVDARIPATSPALMGERSQTTAQLAITEPTPFKFVGQFESQFAPRGSVFTRHYTLERNGFEGPIEIALADRQARHLQGVTGEKVVVPTGVNEFDFAIQLPPFLDIGRTSRTCLKAVGEVTLADGRKGKVAYSSQQQNDQIIVLTAPEQFQIEAAFSTSVARPQADLEIPVTIHRGPMLNGPARVEIIAPRHIHGVIATPLVIAAGDANGRLLVRIDERNLGPFNMPLSIRATTQDANGRPVIAECPFEFVTPRLE